jgi:hypothetical protein
MPRKTKAMEPRRTARLVLKKHSAVIQMSNVVTGVQRKAWNVLLYHARDALRRGCQDRIFEVPLSEVRRWTGIETTDHTKLKKALLALMDVVVEVNLLGKDTEKWEAFVLLPYAAIEGGVVRFELTERLRQVLVHPRMYAPLDLGILRGLRGKYAIALYELARDYVGAEVPLMSLDEFRKIMGVRPEEYRRFADFLNRVILPAVREVNEVTDLEVSYTLFRDRKTRRWASIKFSVRRKGEGIAAEDILLAYARARDYGFVPPPEGWPLPRILWAFSAGDDPRVVAALLRAAEGEAIRNPVGFLRSKFQSPPSERLEPLLHMDRLPAHLEEALWQAYAVRIHVPSDWRARCATGVLSADIIGSLFDKLVQAGQAREVRDAGGGAVLEFMLGPEQKLPDFASMLLLPSLGGEARVIWPGET